MQCCLMKRELVMLMVKKCTRKTGSVSIHNGKNVRKIIFLSNTLRLNRMGC